jgi:hypothetical protein
VNVSNLTDEIVPGSLVKVLGHRRMSCTIKTYAGGWLLNPQFGDDRLLTNMSICFIVSSRKKQERVFAISYVVTPNFVTWTQLDPRELINV